MVGEQLMLASSRGDVVTLDGATGREVGRVAGVGSDGKRLAVVTDAAQLVALAGGKKIGRQGLGAQAYTAPLVAGCLCWAATARCAPTTQTAQMARHCGVRFPLIPSGKTPRLPNLCRDGRLAKGQAQALRSNGLKSAPFLLRGWMCL